MATTTKSALATVQKFYELVPAGKIDEAAQLMADDLVVREPPDLPYGGDFRGASGFVDIITRIGELTDFGVTGEVDFHEAGDRVMVCFVGRFKSRASGRTVETDIVELFSVRDGQIVEIDVYYKAPGAVTALIT